MLKLFMTGVSAIALASTAALADPAQTEVAQATETAQATDAPQYMSKPSSLEAAITPLEVTTRADSEKLAATEFAAADTNKDGTIDETEFAAFAAYSEQRAAGVDAAKATPAEKAFVAIAKGDKKISKQELADARGKSFDAADANRDKLLDKIEQQKFAALVAVKPAGADKL
ncbi:MAG: hypothetical protein AAB227_03315 [Pseudomonadota bacterium]